MIVFAKVFNYFAAASCNSGGFFGIPHWWEFVKPQPVAPACDLSGVKFPDGIWPIGLGVVDIMLHIAGFVAVFAVIYGGISYMLAIGNAEKITSARRGITHALIGLGIVLIATQVVSFIGGHVG